jgi:formylglycine-generating enzyme required for sulfatase activity
MGLAAVHAAVAAESAVTMQAWSSDAAGFADFNAELMLRDEANLLKFPGAKLVVSDGISYGQAGMLTDGTAGVWVGAGRIGAGNASPSRIVFDLGRPRLIREIRVLTSNSDTRTNQDYEIRLARKSSGLTGLPRLPDEATFTSGDKVIGPNAGPCISSIVNPAGGNLTDERCDVIEFRIYPAHQAKAGSPARSDMAKRGWTSLVELQVLADPDDSELFESPEQRRAWLAEMERKRKMARLAGLSQLASAAVQNLVPLERAIDDLATTCPERFPAERYRARLDEFVRQLDAVKPEELDTPEAVQRLELLTTQFEAFRREVLLSNPLLDFGQILLVQRSGPGNGLPANWQSNSQLRQKTFDDSIEILSLDNLDGETDTLFKPSGGLMVSDVDLHFDADRLMFSMMDANSRWQVWEINADGTGLRQITPSDPDDVDHYDSCYLPDGRIIFTSTACMIGVPCVYGNSHVTNTYICDADGANIRQLTFDQEHNWSPCVMNSGRILYQRWEYADLPHSNSRMLFSMNPDGTSQFAFYGTNSLWPNSIFYARPIPDSPSKVVGIISGHHGVARQGEMIIFDAAIGRREAEGVVQRIGDYGKRVEPVVADNLVGGSWPRFLHPYPLSDKYYLAAVQPTPSSRIGIYLVDVFDNMLLLRESASHQLMEPVPWRKTTRPPIVQDRIVPGAKEATVYLTDVYNGPGLGGIPRGAVKQLRVYTYGFSYQNMGGLLGIIGLDGPWDMRRVMGTVPVEEDGSAQFTVPANLPIAVQPLDEQGRALQLMRSWMTAMPGEVLQCNGCHESQNNAALPKTTLAIGRRPAPIAPWYGPTRGFDYSREVQPVIDRYCVGCHNGKPLADGRTTVNLRGDLMIDDFAMVTAGNGGNHGGRFSVGYAELHRYVRRSGIESDIHLLTPMEFHASTTELVQMLEKGHQGVVLDDQAWDRILTWIDMNCPYHGTWGEQLNEAAKQQNCRRMELAKRYAGIEDDAEYLPPASPEPIEFVHPQPVVRPSRKDLAIPGWPWSADEAVKRQAAANEIYKTIDLGGEQSLRLALVPPGEFIMGSTDGPPDEWPPAVVRIEQPFWIGVHEISNAQYAQFDPSHDSHVESKQAYQFGVHGYPMDRPEQPVVRVSWERAMAFCRWLSEKTGCHVTLPTESQWEYAARAGSDRPFWFGGLDEDFGPYANLADVNIRKFASNPYTVDQAYENATKYDDYMPRDPRFDDGMLLTGEGGRYKPNPWGLCDMHGNVAEWTLSAYRPYPYDSADGREALTGTDRRVVRGGSWRDRPMRSTASYRLGYEPYQRVFNVGFRIVVAGDAAGSMELAWGEADAGSSRDPGSPERSPSVPATPLDRKASGQQRPR